MSMAIWPTSNKSATYVYINIPEGCSFGVVRGQSHCLRLWGHGFEASSRLWIIMGRRNQIKLKLNDLNLCLKALFFKKWGNPGLFLVYFGHFQTKIITIFTTNWCEKCHVHLVYGAGIRTHNVSNMSRLPEPLDQGFIFVDLDLNLPSLTSCEGIISERAFIDD